MRLPDLPATNPPQSGKSSVVSPRGQIKSSGGPSGRAIPSTNINLVYQLWQLNEFQAGDYEGKGSRVFPRLDGNSDGNNAHEGCKRGEPPGTRKSVPHLKCEWGTIGYKSTSCSNGVGAGEKSNSRCRASNCTDGQGVQLTGGPGNGPARLGSEHRGTLPKTGCEMGCGCCCLR